MHSELARRPQSFIYTGFMLTSVVIGKSGAMYGLVEISDLGSNTVTIMLFGTAVEHGKLPLRQTTSYYAVHV